MGAVQSSQEKSTTSDDMKAESNNDPASSTSDNKPAEFKKERPPPYMFQKIVGNEASLEEVGTKLRCTGIFLENKKKKYWVDDENNCCFMLLPRGLSITWGDDVRYWKWVEESDAGTTIEVAELLDVCSFGVRGSLEQSHLNTEVTYMISFDVKLKKNAYGWDNPVEVGVTSADGATQSRKVNLQQMEREKWLQLKAGEVKPQGQDGKIQAFMRQDGVWKRGLLIKGITISTK